MKDDSIQTRLEQWEGAEYPDKRPRYRIIDEGWTGEKRLNPANIWLVILVSAMLYIIYLI